MADPLTLWLIVIASAGLGALIGVLFERTRGTAAQRAAKFEAELVQARSDLMHYQEQTRHHFGKSAELLGRMATDYREFLDHFVTGAETLCGPNLKELDASGLDRPLLEGGNGARAVATTTATTAPIATIAEPAAQPPIASTAQSPRPAPTGATTTVPPIATIAAATVPPMAPIAANATVPPLAPLDSDPFAEDVAK